LKIFKNLFLKIKMKIIAIGDPHFKVKNIAQIDIFIDQLMILIQEKAPDFIVVLGDLLHHHERIHSIALNKAYEFMDKLRGEAFTYILVGNHDMINNQQFLTQNHWMNGMKEWDNVKVVDETFAITMDDLKFVFCPYVPNGRFIEALDRVEWKDASCIFAHQEFYGCKMGFIESTNGDKWDLSYPYVLSGHIHSNQIVQKNIYYPGSAMQHAFGDSEKTIIPCIKIDKDRRSIVEIDLGLSKKRIIYIDVDALESYTPPETNDHIRLTVSGTYEQFKVFKKSKKYKILVDKGLKVVYKHRRKTTDLSKEIKTNDFFKILKTLVDKEENQGLTEDFERIIS